LTRRDRSAGAVRAMRVLIIDNSVCACSAIACMTEAGVNGGGRVTRRLGSEVREKKAVNMWHVYAGPPLRLPLRIAVVQRTAPAVPASAAIAVMATAWTRLSRVHKTSISLRISGDANGATSDGAAGRKERGGCGLAVIRCLRAMCQLVSHAVSGVSCAEGRSHEKACNGPMCSQKSSTAKHAFSWTVASGSSRAATRRRSTSLPVGCS